MTSIINYISELYYKYQGKRDLCKNCNTYRCNDEYCGCSLNEKKLRIKIHNIITKLFNEKDKDEINTLLIKFNIIQSQIEKYEKVNFHDL